MGEKEGEDKKSAVNKNIIVLGGTFIILVVIFLAYNLLQTKLSSPCETIFEQTSMQLGLKLEHLGTGGELILGKDKVQELSDRAQETALNLKACCIVLDSGKVDSGQFLECKNKAGQYEEKLDSLVTQVSAATKAKEENRTEEYEEKVRQIHITLDNVESASRELNNIVETLKKREKEGLMQTEPNRTKDITQPSEPAKIKVSAVLSEGGEMQPSYFGIYRQGADEFGKARLEKVKSSGWEAEYMFTVPAGEYIVKGSHDKAYAEKKVVVEEGKRELLQLNYHAGRVKVTAVLSEGNEAQPSYFGIYRQGADEFGKVRLEKIKSSGWEAEYMFTVPAGEYIVKGSHDKAYAEKKVVVEEGKRELLQLNYHAGRVKVTAVLSEGGELQPSYFGIYRQGSDEFGKAKLENVKSSGWEAEYMFTVPEGEYIVKGSHDKAYAEKRVVVEEGKRELLQLNYHAGRVKVTAVLSEGGELQPSYFGIYRQGSDEFGKARLEKVKSSGWEAEYTFTVPAGEYIVKGSHDKAYAEKKVVVEEGKARTIQLVLQRQ